jgi:phosphoserine phosphatase
MNEKLYILFGTGPDGVGLVQQITTPIAGIGGNVMDLRQDVLHGLFTLFLVVDFAGSAASEEEIGGLVAQIAEQTGLELRVEKYQPVARSAEREDLLLILIGRDRPGIIAAVSECLSSYRVNIELSQMIARESIFVMELLVDIRRSTLPLKNLRSTLRGNMAGLGIETLFQDRDVFNKKKRVLLFELSGSFMEGATRDEILRQAGIPSDELRAIYPQGDARACLAAALARLEGLPVEVVKKLADAAAPTPGTAELIQTLKTMGYQVALASGAFTLLTDRLRGHLGLDHCYGIEAPVDEDAMTFAGEPSGEELTALGHERIVEALRSSEGVALEDITLVTDRGFGDGAPPGIHLVFDTRLFLDFVNQHVLSRESLVGVLGAFGSPVAR